MSTTSPRFGLAGLASSSSSSACSPVASWLRPPPSGAPVGCGFGLSSALGAGSCAGCSAWADFGFSAAAFAGSAALPSTVSTICPTLTFCPCLTFTSCTVPATVEGTSMVALSVSSSRIGWSLTTVSPGLTSTRTTSPDVTFSPSSGILNSVGMCRQLFAGFCFSGLIPSS